MSAPAMWGTRARLGVAANVAGQVAFVVAILIALNWLSARRYRRVDLTDDVSYTLGGKTLGVLEKISSADDRYQVVVFFAPDEYGAWEAALARTRDLLEEYRTRSNGRITYEVVPLLSVGREGVASAKRRLELRSEFTANDVIFKKGDVERTVNLKEFFGQEWEDMGPRGTPRLTSFNGESIVTAMLVALSQERPIRIAFTAGHEEISPDDAEPTGWGAFAHQILEKREGYAITRIEIGGVNGVPKEVDVLAIVSPRRDFSEADLRNLRLFMEGGGRLFVALDAGPEVDDPNGKRFPNLFGFLGTYGIEPQGDIVFDEDNALQFLQGERISRDKTAFRIAWFDREHAVTRKFTADTEVTMAGACTLMIDPGRAPEGFRVVELAKSSSGKAYGERGYLGSDKTQRDRFTPNVDIPGPLTLAVAASGTAKGTTVETRLFVMGDATALVNGVLPQFGRPDLALNAIRWLAKQEHLIQESSKRNVDRTLHLTAAQDGWIFRVCVLFLPLMAIAFGGTMWLTRRSQ
ncbi:MAG: GldG family protein [Candidatus Brocadiae bacterium]|nr:GldG family protein [Candidatus Brocadiia bacterium]